MNEIWPKVRLGDVCDEIRDDGPEYRDQFLPSSRNVSTDDRYGSEESRDNPAINPL